MRKLDKPASINTADHISSTRAIDTNLKGGIGGGGITGSTQYVLLADRLFEEAVDRDTSVFGTNGWDTKVIILSCCHVCGKRCGI